MEYNWILSEFRQASIRLQSDSETPNSEGCTYQKDNRWKTPLIKQYYVMMPVVIFGQK